MQTDFLFNIHSSREPQLPEGPELRLTPLDCTHDVTPPPQLITPRHRHLTTAAATMAVSLSFCNASMRFLSQVRAHCKTLDAGCSTAVLPSASKFRRCLELAAAQALY
jgi:hypothetical protein